MPLFSRIVGFFFGREEPKKTTAERPQRALSQERERERDAQRAKLEIKPESKPEVKPEVKQEVKQEVKTEGKAENKSDRKSRSEKSKSQRRKGDAIYPPSRGKPKAKKEPMPTESAPATKKTEEKKDTSTVEGRVAKGNLKISPQDEKKPVEKAPPESEYDDNLTRDDVNQLMAELTAAEKEAHSVEFDPWADLEVLRERNDTIFDLKYARVNTAVAHSRLLDLEFESQRTTASTGGSGSNRPSMSESVLRRTYSVRDRNKMIDDMITLNDDPLEQPKKEK
ncbi:hypothetical protein QR680_013406 [Steinernema hermaphroditum]|uniref:Uncharacterized protein n=1 Tax=Steinernema hermaphroditum TaxID=289476 RepID=A0AA39M2G5_9BILA|nr:hypothetical protein QR680_013406 [Steinernema hermaphroditum]